MSLASLTQATHQNAERTEFAREMMSGKMSNDKYTKFLECIATGSTSGKDSIIDVRDWLDVKNSF